MKRAPSLQAGHEEGLGLSGFFFFLSWLTLWVLSSLIWFSFGESFIISSPSSESSSSSWSSSSSSTVGSGSAGTSGCSLLSRTHLPWQCGADNADQRVTCSTTPWPEHRYERLLRIACRSQRTHTRTPARQSFKAVRLSRQFFVARGIDPCDN